MLGSFWDNFGIILGPFWDNFGMTLGSFWDHFGRGGWGGGRHTKGRPPKQEQRNKNMPFDHGGRGGEADVAQVSGPNKNNQTETDLPQLGRGGGGV